MACATTPVVVNDALGALRSGSPDWSGVSVVAGTYNAIGARRADGHRSTSASGPTARAGATSRATGEGGLPGELDLGPETALSGARSPATASTTHRPLHEFTRRGGLQLADQDAFAPDVLEAADAGDPVA